MPIIGRITVNGNAVEFRPHLSIKSELWSVAKGKAIGRSAEIVQLNTMLNSIRKVISAHYQTLSAEDGYVTAEKIREAYLGQDERTLKRVAEEKRGKTTLIDFFGKFNAEYKLKVDAKLVTKRTYSRYVLTKERLIDFMKQKYKVEDIPFKELKREFIEKYVVYLSTVRGMLPGTLPNAIKKLKLMTYTAFKNGWIASDPFAGFRVAGKYRDRRFLSESELQAVMDVQVPNYKTAIVRDIFVFCCFTGLAYADVQKLSYDDIHTDERGDIWIIDNRAKTGTQFRVKLLPVAKSLIKRYSHLRLSDNRVFPVKDGNSMNMSLRHVARHAGLSFNPTMHVARHTFSTTITLSQGVPLETVSKMLGHKHITTTQIYAKITNDKIGRDMDMLTEKIADKFRMDR